MMDGSFAGGKLRPNTAAPGIKRRNYASKTFGTGKDSITTMRSKQTGITNAVLAQKREQIINSQSFCLDQVDNLISQKGESQIAQPHTSYGHFVSPSNASMFSGVFNHQQ